MPTAKKPRREIAAPRPLSPADPLGRALLALDGAPCDCPLGKVCLRPRACPGEGACDECPPGLDLARPCPHAAAADHDFTLEEWLSLMRAYDADGMAERPPPPPASPAVTKKARLNLYVRRAHRGHALFGARDADAEALDAVAIQGGPNLHEGGVRASRAAEAPPEPVRPWGRPPTPGRGRADG